jgi:hypothetical protein
MVGRERLFWDHTGAWLRSFLHAPAKFGNWRKKSPRRRPGQMIDIASVFRNWVTQSGKIGRLWPPGHNRENLFGKVHNFLGRRTLTSQFLKRVESWHVKQELKS